jgi:glycosyltransferase involved in cell wall biosynthesis
MPPLVSILTPSYNQADWLRDNLSSVGNQTYANIEHVVMDGGSTDGSLEILEQSHSRVRWRSESDRGQSHALNKAFDQSEGEIIGWLNSDDAYVDRRSVQSVVDIFEQRPEVGFVYGHGLLVNRSNTVLQYIWVPPFSRAAMLRRTFFVQPSAFIRRSVVSPPLVDENLHYVMDRDLWWRLLDRTQFCRVDRVIGLDRYQPDRKTLQPEYPKEREAYDRSHGIDPNSRARGATSKMQTVTFRLRGVPRAIRLPQEVDPAVELDFGSLASRFRLQALTVRSRMPIA